MEYRHSGNTHCLSERIDITDQVDDNWKSEGLAMLPNWVFRFVPQDFSDVTDVWQLSSSGSLLTAAMKPNDGQFPGSGAPKERSSGLAQWPLGLRSSPFGRTQQTTGRRLQSSPSRRSLPGIPI